MRHSLCLHCAPCKPNHAPALVLGDCFRGNTQAMLHPLIPAADWGHHHVVQLLLQDGPTQQDTVGKARLKPALLHVHMIRVHPYTWHMVRAALPLFSLCPYAVPCIR